MVGSEYSEWRDGARWWIQGVFPRPEFRRCGAKRLPRPGLSARPPEGSLGLSPIADSRAQKPDTVG